MPKELTHWVLADRIYDHIQLPHLKKIIQENRQLYYLGAVFPDLGFYKISGEEHQVYQAASQRVHGKTGLDPLSFLRRVAKSVSDSDRDPIWALCAGIVAHCTADSQFHPWVYYFTGDLDVDDPDRSFQSTADHRLIESSLDMYYRKQHYNLNNGGSLSYSLRHAELPAERIEDFCGFYFFDQSGVRREDFKRLLSFQAFIQSLFTQPVARWLISALAWWKKKFEIFRTFVYLPKSKINFDFFTEQRAFKHPVTGADMYLSVQDLEQRVMLRGERYFSQIEQYLTTGNIDILDGIEGTSLETDLPASVDQTMKFFYPGNFRSLILKSRKRKEADQARNEGSVHE